MTGKFFALEGPECSGKTTLFNILKEKLQKNKVKFIPEAAERFSKFSPELYKDKESMEIAYMIDNAIIIHKVNDLIAKNYNVIMDRSWVCQIVYAQTRRILNPNYNFDIKYIHKFERILRTLYPKVFENTIVVYIDAPIEVILQRGLQNPNHHRSEEFSLKWLKIAKDLYEKRLNEISKDIKIERIDGAVTIDVLLSEFLRIYWRYTKSSGGR